MKRVTGIVIAAAALSMAANVASADVTLNSVRVAGTDTVALAKFYQSALGMHEVNRIDVPGGPVPDIRHRPSRVDPRFGVASLCAGRKERVNACDRADRRPVGR